MKKLVNHKGYTMIEALLALFLLGLVMLSVFGIVSYVSQTLSSTQVTEELSAVCLGIVEEQYHALKETHTLEPRENITTGSSGGLQYTIKYTIVNVDYPGAFKLILYARADSGQTLEREVILYDEPI